MTLPVFPALDGLDIEVTCRADFKTTVFEALSGRERRVRLRGYPKYTFTVSFNFLVDDLYDSELNTLKSFMYKASGMYGAFLYRHETDCHAENCYFNEGDGVKKSFRLVRKLDSYFEPVEILNGEPLIYLDGVLKTAGTHYTIGDTGVVTWVTAPGAGAIMTWTGDYYYKVRFLQDGYDIKRLLSDIHECVGVDFVGSIRDII